MIKDKNRPGAANLGRQERKGRPNCAKVRALDEIAHVRGSLRRLQVHKNR